MYSRFEPRHPCALNRLHQESFGSRHTMEIQRLIHTTFKMLERSRASVVTRSYNSRKMYTFPSLTRFQRATHSHGFSLQSCSSVSSASPSARMYKPRPMVFACLVDPSPIWGYLHAKDQISIAQVVGTKFLRPPVTVLSGPTITPCRTDKSLG